MHTSCAHYHSRHHTLPSHSLLLTNTRTSCTLTPHCPHYLCRRTPHYPHYLCTLTPHYPHYLSHRTPLTTPHPHLHAYSSHPHTQLLTLVCHHLSITAILRSHFIHTYIHSQTRAFPHPSHTHPSLPLPLTHSLHFPIPPHTPSHPPHTHPPHPSHTHPPSHPPHTHTLPSPSLAAVYGYGTCYYSVPTLPLLCSSLPDWCAPAPG